MDLGRLGAALQLARRFGLNSVDVIILAKVLRRGETTIMDLSSEKHIGSLRTVQRRVTRMVQSGFLVRSASLSDERVKPIHHGPKLKGFLVALSGGPSK